ncbi:hypothetical protein [Methanofollis ethanolicus]|uniref:hypothetical protein n=1 Tax=Methanofollis ethanolicus TaxID=488124 RepID=UPI00128EC962|nr:hypothetical protein [Methanofollis ethanolicus]
MYSYWGTVIAGLIKWPSMLIITESLSRVAGINYLWLFEYQEPLLGMIFFLAIFVLAYYLSKNYGVALLSGLISSLASHVIFYQSEYHYQGYAYIMFVFLLISLLATCRCKNQSRYKILAIIFTFACAFSHYFSSLFILFILGVFFCFVNLISVFNQTFSNSRLNIIKINNPTNLFFFISFILVISYHLFVYPKNIEQYIDMILSADPYHASLITSGKGGKIVPFPTNIIHGIRYVLLLLGFTSILYAIRKNKTDEIILGIICATLVFLGILGNTLVYLEVGRIVAFYEVLIGIFAALTLFRLRNLWLRALKNQKLITAILCIVTAGIVTLTFFGGHYIPDYYFKSLDQNNYYWCNNDLPEMQEYKYAGTWVHNYAPENSYFVSIDSSDYFIYSAIFFWGHVSYENHVKNRAYLPKDLNEPIFTLSNRRNFSSGKKRIMDVTNKLYSNEEIEMTAY